MAHLTIIRIKNSDFDYEKYGLKKNYFSLDVTLSFSQSKAVGVTQYALLDGTTRLDNISKQPGQVSLQGEIGELRVGNNPANFAYDTVERNRLQNQKKLLEALRDNAIFLDFVTAEDTYKDYILTSCNFAKSTLGKMNVNISAREVILFGDDVDITSNNTPKLIEDYERDSMLNEFTMKDVETDSELVNETNRIITTSVLAHPFIILLGPVDINPDVVIPEYPIYKEDTKATLPTVPGKSIIVNDTALMRKKVSAAEVYTGEVIGGNYLHISFPLMTKDETLYRQKITNSYADVYEYINLSTTKIHIRLKKGEENLYSVQKGEILKTPLFSDIVNGVHSLSKTGSRSDIISDVKYGINFIRKQKNDKYSLMPNLLGNDSKGYLYQGTYETTTGKESVINPVLVYIHPEAWSIIKDEIERVWEKSEYFKTKELVGVYNVKQNTYSGHSGYVNRHQDR